MSERLTDDQVAWYAGTSRTAKWTADMAVHENIVTLAREVQAHRSSCDRIIRDRDEWNEHLANEASLLVMAVPRVLRGLYLRRVARLRRRATT